MKTGSPAYGSPELAKSLFFGAALAKLYRVPCRGGGAFTDAIVPDIQAGMESALVLSAAAMSGMDLSICSCGMLGSYLGMSFEKFLADEELCGMLKKLIQPVRLSKDDFCLDLIKKIGIGNTYMTESHTVERCRTEFFIPCLLNRSNKAGTEPLHKKAKPIIQKRLKDYEPPNLDRETLRELDRYVSEKKRLILKS
jgi:trimethylamine--corrinoid protein Co-methyltransferase